MLRQTLSEHVNACLWSLKLQLYKTVNLKRLCPAGLESNRILDKRQYLESEKPRACQARYNATEPATAALSDST